jgi:hypothetical protein
MGNVATFATQSITSDISQYACAVAVISWLHAVYAVYFASFPLGQMPQ